MNDPFIGHAASASESADGAPASATDGGCVVFAWPEFEPDNLFSGLAASRLALAEALAARGTHVVMAWTGQPGGEGEARLRDWVKGRCGGSIMVEAVPVACQLHYPRRLQWQRAFDFHLWLQGFWRGTTVAAVNLPETFGVAYYALLAKRGGLDFGSVRFVVEVSGPLRRLRALGHRAIDNLEDLYQDFLERRCIELADALVVPDASVPAWLSGHGWTMPAHVSVVAPVVGATKTVERVKRASRLVFVGPLAMEGRLPRVCRALGDDAVKARLADREIVFWGPAGEIRGKPAMEYIGAAAEKWPFRWRVESDLSTRAAERLFGDGAGAAMFPAGHTAAWLPNQWCQDAGVFCAGPEWAPERAGQAANHQHMDAANLRRLEEAPDPEAIERALDAMLGDVAPPWERPPNSRDQRIEARAKILLEPAATVAHFPGRETPLVSVCIVTRNRSRLLPQALASIEAQDYPNIEVVLVDDGSTMKRALALLDSLGPQFRQKGWKLLRQEHAFHAAARNRAVSEARGDWVMLLDDDCVSEPHQIRRMLFFATNIGADIVTCPRHVFVGDDAPATGDRSGFVWAPLGAVPAACLFENCVGDTNLLARREAFLGLGGLRTDFRVPAADREFLIRATASGLRVEVMPEVLYHYRVTANSVSRGLTPEGEALRDLRFARPFVEALPPALADLPRIAADGMRRCQSLEKDLANCHARIARLEERLGIYHDRTAWEIRIRLTPRSMRDWLVRLSRSIRKRLWGHS